MASAPCGEELTQYATLSYDEFIEFLSRFRLLDVQRLRSEFMNADKDPARRGTATPKPAAETETERAPWPFLALAAAVFRGRRRARTGNSYTSLHFSEPES